MSEKVKSLFRNRRYCTSGVGCFLVVSGWYMTKAEWNCYKLLYALMHIIQVIVYYARFVMNNRSSQSHKSYNYQTKYLKIYNWRYLTDEVDNQIFFILISNCSYSVIYSNYENSRVLIKVKHWPKNLLTKTRCFKKQLPT